MDALAPAVDATTGVVANPLFKGFNPLKFMLASLGIPVDHLVEGSRKCVAELGPEAMGALKALLVICPPPPILGTLPVPVQAVLTSCPAERKSSTPQNPTTGVPAPCHRDLIAHTPGEAQGPQAGIQMIISEMQGAAEGQKG